MIPTKQLPAREAALKGVTVPYWCIDLDKPITYHLRVSVLPMETIDRLVIAGRKHVAKIKPNPNDTRVATDNYDYAPTDRERVNLIRHCLLNRTSKSHDKPSGYMNGYDAILHRIRQKGVDVEQRQQEFKLLTLRLIAGAYPNLARECSHQAWLTTRDKETAQ
jgi:hypothetical protein